VGFLDLPLMGQGEQAFPGFDFWLLQCSTALLALYGSLWLSPIK
jgi:hypothetical protein